MLSNLINYRGFHRDAVPSAMDGAQVVAMESNSQPSQNAGDLGLPYNVCTVTDLEQRAYITNGVVEWVWARLHSFCQIRKEPGRLLMQNKDSIKATCRTLQVSPEEVHYRGRVAEEGQVVASRTTHWKPEVTWYVCCGY